MIEVDKTKIEARIEQIKKDHDNLIESFAAFMMDIVSYLVIVPNTGAQLQGGQITIKKLNKKFEDEFEQYLIGVDSAIMTSLVTLVATQIEHGHWGLAFFEKILYEHYPEYCEEVFDLVKEFEIVPNIQIFN